MKSIKGRMAKLLGICFAVILVSIPAFCQPAFPPNPRLEFYTFRDTNWLSLSGYAPIGFTNLVSVPVWNGNALLLDMSNVAPAFLSENIAETNGHIIISFSSGVVNIIFICDWATADTNQNGTGPGDVAYLLSAGDFSSNSPDGLWGIYFNPGGSNIYFGGVSNSISAVFVSAPISWASNSIHLISLVYGTNTTLFLDGALAGTGDAVSIVPSTNVWSNGFNIGSDAFGYEQARGIFKYLELDDSNWFTFNDSFYFTNWWPYISNTYASWQGGGGADFNNNSGSLLSGGGGGGCVTGTNIYMTNMSYAVMTGLGNVFTFTIAGGQPGSNYDVFSTTALATLLTNSGWTWLGQGTNCGTYSATNQPDNPTFYLLGNSVFTNDGSGLTVAYERLIGTSSDGYGTPSLWYVWQGLSPVIAGLPNGGNDADGDGLLNYQEYLYGTNPTVSEGFAIWVSEPALSSGIP